MITPEKTARGQYLVSHCHVQHTSAVHIVLRDPSNVAGWQIPPPYHSSRNRIHRTDTSIGSGQHKHFAQTKCIVGEDAAVRVLRGSRVHPSIDLILYTTWSVISTRTDG